MAGYLSVKMKRKDLEEVADDFSEFSLSSPARKIRRLDAELPPIMEEEESGVPIDFDQVLPEEQTFSAPVLEEDLSLSSNDERALVLYKPMNTPLLDSLSSSNFSITVNSDLIPSFKDRRGFWSGNPNFLKVEKEAEHGRDENGGGNGQCLAVVPWVSSHQFPSTLGSDLGAGVAADGLLSSSEPMDAEAGTENAEMEVEMDPSIIMGVSEWQERQGNVGPGGGLQQWTQQQQQQHCMNLPQLPQNRSTPIMWS